MQNFLKLSFPSLFSLMWFHFTSSQDSFLLLTTLSHATATAAAAVSWLLFNIFHTFSFFNCSIFSVLFSSKSNWSHFMFDFISFRNAVSYLKVFLFLSSSSSWMERMSECGWKWGKENRKMGIRNRHLHSDIVSIKFENLITFSLLFLLLYPFFAATAAAADASLNESFI